MERKIIKKYDLNIKGCHDVKILNNNNNRILI